MERKGFSKPIVSPILFHSSGLEDIVFRAGGEGKVGFNAGTSFSTLYEYAAKDGEGDMA